VSAALSAEELRARAEQAQRRAELARAAWIELGLAHEGVELRIGSARSTSSKPCAACVMLFSSETGQLVAERIVG